MTEWLIVKRVAVDPRWPQQQAELEKALDERLAAGERRALTRVGLAANDGDATAKPTKPQKPKPARARTSKTTPRGTTPKGRGAMKPSRPAEQITAEERFTRSLARDSGGGSGGLIVERADGSLGRVGGGRTIR
jgi:hypothetical protein